MPVSPDLVTPELTSEELGAHLADTLRRSAEMRTQRGRRRSIAGAVAVSLVIAVSGASLAALRSPTSPTSPATPATSSRAAVGTAGSPQPAPAWTLVGDVSSSWTASQSSGYSEGIHLDCPSTTTCYAEDISARQLEVTHDGGAIWQTTSLPGSDQPAYQSMSCVTPEECFVLAQDAAGSGLLLATTDGGDTWTSSQIGSGFVATIASVISCTSISDCVVAGGTATTLNGGQPAQVLVTADAGSTWSAVALPTDFQPIAVSCSSNGNCLLTGADASSIIGTGDGAAMYSTDGGATWQPATVPSDSGAITSLDCTDPTDCIASTFAAPGSQLLSTSDGGQSWSATSTSGIADGIITSVSCPVTGTCWTGGTQLTVTGQAVSFANAEGQITSTTNGGTTWQQAALPSGIRAVADVTCPSTTTCYAVAFDHPAGSADGQFVFLTNQG